MFLENVISYDKMIEILDHNFDKIEINERDHLNKVDYCFNATLVSESIIIKIFKTINVGLAGGAVSVRGVHVYTKDEKLFFGVDRSTDVVEWLIERYYNSIDVEKCLNKLFDEFGV